MRKVGIFLFSVVVAITLIVLVLFFSGRPPSEDKIVAKFVEHRSAYAQLRDMLAQDRGLLRVADWGIETEAGLEKPGEGRLSVARYNEYLQLLKEVDAIGASRAREEPATPCILVWASGFAAYTRHRSICWLTDEPGKKVIDLDDRSGRRRAVLKQIEGSWYIWAD